MREHDRQILAVERAERLRRYDEAMTEQHRDDAPHLSAAAIAACRLCDDEGYRPTRVVCDHVDRTAVAKAGAARVRAALAAKGKP